MNRLDLLLKALVELTRMWGDAKYNHGTKLHHDNLKQAIANSTAVDENLLIDAMKVYK